MMATLEQIRTLADKVDGPLPSRYGEQGRQFFTLEMTRVERDIIADALSVLYGVETCRARLRATLGDER